ncbi:MAG: oligosaccharide flippase family protein [Clostridia bacterium]|nr:oligosaccharide flippase family protein [Clostridia bacterium]
MAKNEVKWGAILSYILIILNTLYGFFITPYILGRLGNAEYGVYKTISSFTASLMVLDLGLGGTLLRYISKFRADKEEDKIPNYVAMCFLQAAIIILIIAGVCLGLYFFIDTMFSSGLTASEIVKAKELFIYLSAGICAHVFENVLNGIITGYNNFTFANGLKVIRLLFRILFIVLLLQFFTNSVTLVIIDLALTVLIIFVELIYIAFKLKIKVKLKKWDNVLFKSSFVFTVLLFITSIAAQINGNLDNVIVGALVNSNAVTVYSMGLLIFAMFEQLSTSVSSVMLPTVTLAIKNDDDALTNTQKLVVKIGRIQFMLLGMALAGFIVVGKQFVSLWLGAGFEDVYLIVLILMAPSLLELSVNVCLSILRAQNNLGFRTLILLATTVLNAVITLVGTYYFNYFAAAIGTAASFLIGSVIIMNIYYFKKYKFNMIKIYRRIFSGIWICLILSAVASYLATLIFTSVLLKFVLGVIAFIIVYAITMILFGFNKEEKAHLPIINRKIKE